MHISPAYKDPLIFKITNLSVIKKDRRPLTKIRMKKFGGGGRGTSLSRFPTKTSVRSKLRDKNVPQCEVYALQTAANYQKMHKNAFWVKLFFKKELTRILFLSMILFLKCLEVNYLRNTKRNQTKLLNHQFIYSFKK